MPYSLDPPQRGSMCQGLDQRPLGFKAYFCPFSPPTHPQAAQKIPELRGPVGYTGWSGCSQEAVIREAAEPLWCERGSVTGIFSPGHPNRPLGAQKALRRGKQISKGSAGSWKPTVSALGQGCVSVFDRATRSWGTSWSLAPLLLLMKCSDAPCPAS